jgi:hypothetical protein
MSHVENPLRKELDRFKLNPLIASLPVRASAIELASKLRFCPITPENLQGIPTTDRFTLLTTYKKTFVPTAQSLEICLSLQKMLLDGYAQRDPSLAVSKRFIYSSGQLKGLKLVDTEWWPSFATGMVMDGISGLGKSQIIDRFLSLYPQVIDHQHNEECGWISLTQLCWLKIHMPSDGSRGGFLEGAFRALDQALGTEYTKQYSSRSWSVEKLLVVFLHLLAVHRCGLLVIEEAQEKNLSQSAFGRDFVTFFLRLLNWGTPTVLIGNPLAFENLRSFSQDVDRFSDGGWHHLLPTLDPASPEWLEDWMPDLWCPTLLEHPDADYTPFTTDPIDETLAGFVWKRTGGVPRYVARLRAEVQDAALRMGIHQVTSALVDAVYRSSPKMIEVHSRIDALVKKDWRALQRFDDIPSDFFRRLWEPPSADAFASFDEASYAGSNERTPATKGRTSRKTKSARSKSHAPGKSSDAALKARRFQDEAIASLEKSAGIGPK